MKNVWILEKFVTVDELKASYIDAVNCMNKVASSDDENVVCVAKEMLEFADKNLTEHPNGYWTGWEGKTAYKQFCYRAKEALIRDHHKSEFRVVKAEIDDDSTTWVGYRNPVINDGVLKYLYYSIGGYRG